MSPSNVSLKPNVNRAKTKRWVEAKQYSYDGNDWGDEEDEEYEEEPPAVPPQPAYTSSQRPGDRPSMLGKDRSRSTDQVLGVDADSAGENRSQSADGRGAGAAPFVRPADIYKRMQEDREKDGLPAATRAHTESPVSTTPPRASAGALQSATGSPSPISTRGRPGVADGKRLSGINTNLTGGSSSNSNIPAVQEPEERQSLQHNPSLGFRSAVNQAFDVPETPASTVESVGRSNSDSTSGVSPIMTSRGYSEGKTPTIAEEPGEMTPKEGGSDGNIIFKPGHRRDLSVPSPGNSPSRTPKITDNDTPGSAYPQISSSAVTETAEDPVPPLLQNKRTSMQFPSGSPGKDLPAPLRFSNNQANLNPSVEAPQHYNTPSVVVPSLSTETSPQDSENDRLRKEIIKTLSRENSPSDGADQEIRNSIVPSEYESYWSQSPEDQRIPEDKAPAVGPPPAPWQGGKPKLAKKFSWESSEEEEAEEEGGDRGISGAANASSSQLVQDPPIPGQLPPDETATPPATGVGTGTETKSTPEKPKLTIIPPSAGDQSSIMSGQNLPELVQPEAADVNEKAAPPTFASTSLSQEPILGFRDILGIKSTDERVRQFDRTRTQFEGIDTGLNHWIQITLQSHPEHNDVAAQNSKITLGAPKGGGRAKFPKLPSFSNFGVMSSGAPEGPPPGHGHVRRSSAPMNKQQVEQRGKEILHTAGMLGGKAGEAAKGFFNRGRSKFKGNGEKVDA